MNTYLLAVEGYFGKEQRFKVEAPDRYEAILIGREHVKTAPQFGGGNWCADSVRCVKKIQPKKAKEVIA